ncbi:MAG: NADP oxidoreductase [Caldilineaceae bacterium]|nr:NADP oxidoreductase [Caldilineaceae bacterium]
MENLAEKSAGLNISQAGNGKVKLATVWLDGCSGCHMSFLDIDERILVLAQKADLVYSPLVDVKEFPEMVDVTLIEGAVSSEGDLEKIKHVREHTRILVSLGDCAVTANVPGMRNPFTVQSVMDRAYIENAQRNRQIPDQVIPALLPKSVPVHEIVPVDVFVPGCPPHRDAIYYVLSELVEGRTPDLAGKTRFGK